MKKNMYTKALVGTGLLIGIATILRSFGMMIPIAGAAAMRISFDGIFYKMAGLIFGPVFGALAGGLTDLLACLIRPVGAFIPFMTLTTMLAGFLPAVIWQYIKNASLQEIKKYYILTFSVLGFLGLINQFILLLAPNSTIAKTLLLMGKKATYLGIGLVIICLIGFALLLLNQIIKSKSKEVMLYDNFLKLIVAVGLPNLLVTTINTYLLILFIPSLKGKVFMILWAPRMIEALMMIIVESYVMSVLLYSYSNLTKKAFSLK